MYPLRPLQKVTLVKKPTTPRRKQQPNEHHQPVLQCGEHNVLYDQVFTRVPTCCGMSTVQMIFLHAVH